MSAQPAHEPDELAELRYLIYLCRMCRQHFTASGEYGKEVFAEEQYRRARARYRRALLSADR